MANREPIGRRVAFPAARGALAFGLGLAFVAGCYLALCAALKLPLLEHSAYDSYTLQAMMWRAGRISLDHDYPWLEIARYGGQLYISFPPFPSVPMLLLSFFFGAETPSRLVSFALVLGSYALGWRIARRAGWTPGRAAFAAAFLVVGCNLTEYGLYGGVWNMAQAMAFFLAVAAFDGVLSEKPFGMAAGLIAIACAVGCRPFMAAYVPVLMLMTWKSLHKDRTLREAAAPFIAMLAVPAIIACAYGWYNYARFGNPLEFGHNYLPEFLEQSKYGQFSLHYVIDNFQNILRLPWQENGMPTFPTAFGFAFWLVNPLYVLFTVAFIRKARRGADASNWLLLAMLAVHFFATLMHKSLGGVQFGTRYLCDLIPAMYCLWTLNPSKRPVWRGVEYAVMVLGIAVNLYGAWYFHVLVGA